MEAWGAMEQLYGVFVAAGVVKEAGKDLKDEKDEKDLKDGKDGRGQ
jgi:hypothetical protein